MDTHTTLRKGMIGELICNDSSENLQRNKYNVLLNSDFNINPNRKKDLFKLRYSNDYMSYNPNHFQIISFIILKFYNLFDLTINFV